MSSPGSDSESDVEREPSEMQSSMFSGVPSEAPTPKIGPNKIQELVQDNQNLRTTMRQLSRSMSAKYHQMEEFYRKLKDSCKRMTVSFEETQVALNDRDRTIAFLKGEKIQLRQKLDLRRFAALNLSDDSSNLNGGDDEKFKAEFDDAVNALQHELKKAVEEKKTEVEKTNFLWQQHFALFENEWKTWGMALQADYQRKEEQMHAEHSAMLEAQQRDRVATEQNYKSQVTSLISEIQNCRLKLENTESDVEKWKLQAGNKESRIYQLSRDYENQKEQNKTLTENIIRIKQGLEDAQHQKNEKEESLDQLFKVYDEERERNQRMGADLTRKSADLDKTYAQFLSAEETIKKKGDEINVLRDLLEKKRHRSGQDMDSETEVSVYRQQAEIYKKDFEMERDARSKIYQECEALRTMAGQYNIEMQKLKQELMKYHQAAQQYPPRP